MTEVSIRSARAADMPALDALYNAFVATSPVTFDVEPGDLDARMAWFAQFAEVGPHRLLVAEEDGRFAGFACSRTFRAKAAYATSVETTIYLDPKCHGRGLGRRLYEALFAAIADEDVHRAYAGITLPNPASVALHQALGFREIGTFHEVGRKLGRYWDVQWFEKALPADRA